MPRRRRGGMPGMRALAAAGAALGAALVAPWAALVTALDYLQEQPETHPLAYTLGYEGLNLPLQLLLLFFEPRWLSHARRVAARQLGAAAVMAAAAALSCALSDASQALALGRALASSAIALGVLEGVGAGAAYGELAACGPVAVHGLVLGGAAGGLLLALLRAVAKAALPGGDGGLRGCAALLFGGAAALQVAGLAAYHWVVVPALEAVERDAEGPASALPSILESEPPRLRSLSSLWGCRTPSIWPTEGGAGGCPTGSGEASVPAEPPPWKGGTAGGAGLLAAGALAAAAAGVKDLEAAAPPPAALLPPARWRAPGRGACASVGAMVCEMWAFAAAAFCVTLVSCALVPRSFLSACEWPLVGSWYPLILVAAWHLGDFAGKLLPVLPSPAGRAAQGRALLLLTAARAALFVPAFAAAARLGAGPGVFLSLAAGLAVSGFFEVDCFAWACDGLHPGDARGVGALLCLGLHAGLLLGAALGFPWPKGAADPVR